ncbi:MAG TPA: diguanylate cyclase [Candidatus Limnocylindrales bacterium]|nr:diguanylate cyclase [Candidatus Limnocylindrales bacterium]
MRHLWGLWPLVPAGAAIVLLAAPESAGLLARPILVALIAVSLAVAVTQSYVRSRIEPLVRVAERLAAGEDGVVIPVRRDDLGRRLAAAVGTLGASMAEAHSEATTDVLTGIPNRPAIIGQLFTEVERSVRYRRPLSVAFADIDHFKTINDTYGHEAGDVVLKGVANAFRRNVRASDRVGRYGGEEFMIVLPETSVEDAAALADKLRLIVAGEPFELPDGHVISVTISLGVTGGAGDRVSFDALVREADAAMYSAKALGRDQVYAFEEPNDDSTVIRSPISPSGRTQAIELGRRAHGAAADALAQIISPLPHYRGQPSALIATIVTMLASQLNLPEHEIDKIRVAALLHDVGKVGIPQDILEKPSSLTPAEWRSVVQHPRIGQVILEQATVLRDAVPIILHHHERFGGAGYPYGLRGHEIPLGARIVAIADAYDAMIQDRPYKRAISHEAAIDELRRHAGTQFDPELVEIFCDIYGDRAPEADPAALGFIAAARSQERAAAAEAAVSRSAVSRSAAPRRRVAANDR